MSQHRIIPIEELIGKKFYLLTVIEETIKDKTGHRQVICLCNCGNYITTKITNLNLSRTRSCNNKDCKYRVSKYYTKDPLAKHIHTRCKRTAKDYQVPFNLDEALVSKLCRENCYYCGSPPKLELISKGSRAHGVKFNGLDRVVPSLGYINSNVISCCWPCNRAKSTLTQDEFIHLCNKVAKAHPTRENHQEPCLT